jgi:hypothetical protein
VNYYEYDVYKIEIFFKVFMWQVLFAKCTCVYATNFMWQVFIWQVLFTGVNVSTCLLWQFISGQQCIILYSGQREGWPITSNAQITLTSFLCWPIQTNNICTLTIFSMTSALVQKLACYSFWTSTLVIEKIVKVARTDEQIKLVT